MTLASTVKKNPSKCEESERIKKLLERRRKKGLPEVGEIPKEEGRKEQLMIEVIIFVMVLLLVIMAIWYFCIAESDNKRTGLR